MGRYVRGAVTVHHNGRWGTICDDLFNDNAATVICRRMGYRYGTHLHWRHHLKSQLLAPGQANMTIWLDNVRCTGRERDIDQCRHNPWGRHNCGHSEDVNIACHNRKNRTHTAHTTPQPPPPPSYTTAGPPQPGNTTVAWVGHPTTHVLNGGSIRSGFVKVYHNGRWGTICDDRFNHEAAKLLCRKMGYRYGVHYYYNHGTARMHRRDYVTLAEKKRMPIWLDDVRCSGSEQDINECYHRPWGQHNCGHSEDVVIGCSNTPWTTFPTRRPWTRRPWTDRPWTDRPWTDRPWTDRPWTDRPWTDRPYTRGPDGYVTYEDIRQLRYQVMRFFRTVYRALQAGVEWAAPRFRSRLEELTRP